MPLPPELQYRVDEPTVILFGCRSYTPYWGEAPSFHFPRRLTKDDASDRPWPRDGTCPVCKGLIGRREGWYTEDPDERWQVGREIDRQTQCGWCDARDEQSETNAAAQRRSYEGKDRERELRQNALKELRDHHKAHPVFTESERRRMENGYRGGILKCHQEPSNVALAYRTFLDEIGQRADWRLVPIRATDGRIIDWCLPRDTSETSQTEAA